MAPYYGVERGGEEGRLPSGRYVVMDGAENPVGTEDFRCAPGPAGWRYVADIQTRLGATAEIEVLFLSPVTLEPRVEPQRYEPLGEEEVETPVGAFRAVRWRSTALRTGFTRDLWVAGELVVRYADVFELVAYDPATGPVPLGEGPTA